MEETADVDGPAEARWDNEGTNEAKDGDGDGDAGAMDVTDEQGNSDKVADLEAEGDLAVAGDEAKGEEEEEQDEEEIEEEEEDSSDDVRLWRSKHTTQ
jgi:hypothetical protein